MSRRTQSDRLVDWPLLLGELERAGLSGAEVARRLGVPQPTVHHWKTGAEPGYSDGARLIALHLEAIIPPVAALHQFY